MAPMADLAPETTTKKPKSKRPLRDLFEGLGIALLMAVLFKYFAIEAYQIPTSSMQPTMMGSVTAGVYDRLIVDKFRYSMFEPKRWDIAVFKYPIRENQNYVKRIVGVGGDDGERLRIAGGNVYRVGDGGELAVLRKPELVQETVWKEIFPARMHVDGGDKLLGEWFSGRGGTWSEQDGTLEFEGRSASSRAILTFAPSGRAGVVNEVWDGYPTGIARKIRDNEPNPLSDQQVQDVRIAFELTPESTPERLSIDISVERPDEDDIEFGFEIAGGEGRLAVTAKREAIARSEPFAVGLRGGATTRFRLAHVDDRLTIEVDGDLLATLDCDACRVLERATLVTPGVRVTGGGKLRIADLVVERDLHYLPSTRRLDPEESTKVVEVPAGHFMMFGDNTLQSVDSRDWTQLEVGVRDGRIVDPKRDPDAPRMRGNLRATPLSENPDPDENPVPVPSLGKVAFTDKAGEVWALDAQINLDAARDNRIWGFNGMAWFEGEHGAWQPETDLVQFVPREHMIGRPVLNFWPLFSPFRFGLIR